MRGLNFGGTQRPSPERTSPPEGHCQSRALVGSSDTSTFLVEEDVQPDEEKESCRSPLSTERRSGSLERGPWKHKQWYPDPTRPNLKSGSRNQSTADGKRGSKLSW